MGYLRCTGNLWSTSLLVVEHGNIKCEFVALCCYGDAVLWSLVVSCN